MTATGGLCACGCGRKTTIAKVTVKRQGVVKGQPRRFLHGHSSVRHGHSRVARVTPEYVSWQAMRERCSNERNPNYPYYGGRGVAYAPRWRHFQNFIADMGPRPPGTTLERLDNDLGYCKENCAWRSRREQARNRRYIKLNTEAAKVIRFFGISSANHELLASLHGVHQSTVRKVVAGKVWQEDCK